MIDTLILWRQSINRNFALPEREIEIESSRRASSRLRFSRQFQGSIIRNLIATAAAIGYG
jgi:hypothetical protein